MDHADCGLLFEAGKALVEKSGLAHCGGSYFLASEDKSAFDDYWKADFDSTFGRYMAWVLFSVGAENLAKAACVCNGVVKVSSKPTLERYVSKFFKELCKRPVLCDNLNEDHLILGYQGLAKVRNRDAHSYRRNVREADFPSVEEIFVPAFNILVDAMRHRGHFSQMVGKMALTSALLSDRAE